MSALPPNSLCFVNYKEEKLDINLPTIAEEDENEEQDAQVDLDDDMNEDQFSDAEAGDGEMITENLIEMIGQQRRMK